MRNDFTIQMEASDGHLTVNSLSGALSHALDFLHGIAQVGEWEVIRVSKSSPFKIVVRNSLAEDSVPSFMRELRSASAHAEPAAQLNESVIAGTRELARTLKNGFANIRLSYPGEEPVNFTPRTARAVRTAYRAVSKRYVEWTTVRGMLEQITISENQRQFRLREQITGNLIRCNFGPSLLEKVKEGLPHRVEIFGKAVASRLKGTRHIDVESVRVLSDHVLRIDELPQVNLLDGADAGTFLERIRGGDE